MLIEGITNQMKTILETSDQAIYIYLDNIHKVCNQKFASLLGYRTPDEWAQDDDPMASVDGKSQRLLVSTYQKAMEHMVGSSVPITWKKKSGSAVDTTVILVPISYQDHLFAMHFIS